MHTQNISEISSEIHKKTTMKKKEGSKMLHKNVTTSKSYLNLFSQTGYGKSQKYSLRTLVYFENPVNHPFSFNINPKCKHLFRLMKLPFMHAEMRNERK